MLLLGLAPSIIFTYIVGVCIFATPDEYGAGVSFREALVWPALVLWDALGGEE